MTRPLYITTTLPYVNADPHIGFALEVVQTDAIARAARLQGREVFFNTGTDEHGQKIAEAAAAAGQDPQSYVDHYAARFDTLKDSLNLSNDAFVRTTSIGHKAAAQELWKLCSAADDIYKACFEGLYCVGCEKYLTERDLVDGKCPLHPLKEPEHVSEENYFFRLSKYTDKLKAHLSKEGSVVPESRRKEALQFVEEGLTDFSISRRKDRMGWGVPVPDDDEHVMYVWFDALTNYISTLGWPADVDGFFNKFWEEGDAVQTAGKDQVRFQSIMWVAMLMSANIKPADMVFYHGFTTVEGQKMSKSTGNVVNPIDLAEEFGTDAVRYFLLRHMHPTEDSDYTRERFIESYNAGLANGLGNLVSRVMKMAEAHLDAPVELSENKDISSYLESLLNFRFTEACEAVWSRIAACDIRIQETEPFKLVKTEPEEGKKLIAELVQEVYAIGVMLEPLMPATSVAIKEAVKANKKPESLFERRG